MLMLLPMLGMRAQITHTDKGSVDANAEKVLAKAQTKMNGCVSFTVTMTSRDSDKKESGRQTAQVLFNGGKYRVTFGDQVMYCDGKNVWSWNKKAKEVVVDRMSDSDDDLMNPAKLLSSYKKNYKAKFIRKEQDGTSVVDLTPKSRKSYYRVRLLVAESGVLKSIEMNNYDSSSAEFKVSAFKSGVKSTEADFVFPAAANKDVEVIDMR